MFDHRHYVPLLKGKRGEFVALGRLDPGTSDQLTPLIAGPPLDEDDVPSLVAPYLDKLLKGLIDYARWVKRGRIFLDLAEISDDAETPDGRAAIRYLVEKARKKKVEAVPTTGLARGTQHQDALQALQTTFDCGFCLRIDAAEEIHEPGFAADVDSLLAHVGVSEADVDLVLDAGSISDMGQRNAEIVLRNAVCAVPNVLDWRTLTTAAGAFPVDLGAFRAGTEGRVSRSAWLAWQALLSKGGLPRLPTFGDYGTRHPDFPVGDMRFPASASIRYTCDDDWLILRGHTTGVRRHGGFGQYLNQCQRLISLPDYSGAGFSWGDGYIQGCATGLESTGNAETWVRVGTNHHMVKAVSQCRATPPAP